MPFLVPDFRIAMTVAVIVVLAELGTISWIRHRYMEKPPLTAALQVGLGGVAGLPHGRVDRQFAMRHQLDSAPNP